MNYDTRRPGIDDLRLPFNFTWGIVRLSEADSWIG